jgi:Zn-dependent protease
MSQFYDVDTTKISYAEIWSDAKLLSPIGWFAKWFRIRLPCSMDEPPVDSILPFVTESLPEFIQNQFQPQVDALATLGFHSPAYLVIREPGTQTTLYWATFLHESGIHFARVQLRHWDKGINSKRSPHVVFFTGFLDGTFLLTSAGKMDLLPPPAVDIKFKTKANAQKLWTLHEQRLAINARQDFAGVPNREELLWALERLHICVRDFQIARGVYRERSAESQAAAELNQKRFEQAQVGGYEHADILAQVVELQEKKPKWTNTLWVLVISIIVFVAAGAAAWDWRFTLWLIPVLLFHEAGHWVAMRLFKYRNMRMFFIPFFGAAVTGQNWNVPGWKKALVALAGPLPGIFLGIAVGTASLILKIAWMNKLAMILLILNGLNLLPFLPLDGGHNLHAILFSRHRWLELGFRLVAVLGLVGIALLGSGYFMIPLIVIMALSLPIMFKLGKVTDELRYANLPEPLPDEDRIPTLTAQTIISQIKPQLPKGTSNKTIAQYTINVFEILNAKPPGVMATLGLMALQGVGLAMAFGFTIILAASGKFGDFRNAMKSVPSTPTNLVRCDGLNQWSGSKADTNAPRHFVIASFDHRTNAVNQFSELVKTLPDNSRLMLFGDSLLISLPGKDTVAHSKWLGEMDDAAVHAFEVATNLAVSMNLEFVPPDTASASNITHLLESCIEPHNGIQLIAPWDTQAGDPEYATFVKARHDWADIEAAVAEVWEDAEMKTLSRQLSAAHRRGEKKEVRRLQEEQTKLTAVVEDRIRERLRADQVDPIDPELLDLHGKLAKLDFKSKERSPINNRIAAKLGAKLDSDGSASKQPDPLAATLDSVLLRPDKVTVNGLTFTNPEHGLPALLDWLCRQKCGSMKYNLHVGYPMSFFYDLKEDEDSNEPETGSSETKE